MYYRLKQPFEAGPNGPVVLPIEWFVRDPDEDTSQTPVLVDQAQVMVPSISMLTQDIIDAAINERRDYAERYSASQGKTLPAEAQVMVNRTRFTSGVGRSVAVAEMKAVQAEEARRAEARQAARATPPEPEPLPEKGTVVRGH